MKNKVRIAVVGTGYFSKFHFDAWMRLGVNIVAICSLNKNEAITTPTTNVSEKRLPFEPNSKK